MSKSNSAESSKSAKSKRAKVEVFTYLNQIAKTMSKRPRVLKMVLALLLSGLAFIFLNAESGLTTAMLYMIAENGKKSGRAGGNVYMRNGRIRGMAIPRLVQNAYTLGARNRFATLSAAFRSLSQDAQLEWGSATGFFKSDRFGRQIPVVGKELYVMLNSNLLNIGEPPISVPPVPDAVTGFNLLQVVADESAASVELSFSPDPSPTGISMLVFATAQLSPGIQRPGNSAFRLVDVIDDGASAPAVISANYIAKFGSPVAGKKIFVKCVPVNETTGQAGPGILASTIVVA